MVNAFCIGFKVVDIKSAGLRAANLSLINMIPLFASSYLSYLADILGVSLRVYRRIHRAGGIMLFFLFIFYVLTVIVTRTAFPLHVIENT
jgi:hypothetical protein